MRLSETTIPEKDIPIPHHNSTVPTQTYPMMAPETTPSTPPPKLGTIIVGISGPSSSGKTTIARLLRRIFSTSQGEEGIPNDNAGVVETFVIHEDDFYLTDDKYGTLLVELFVTLFRALRTRSEESVNVSGSTTRQRYSC